VGRNERLKNGFFLLPFVKTITIFINHNGKGDRSLAPCETRGASKRVMAGAKERDAGQGGQVTGQQGSIIERRRVNALFDYSFVGSGEEWTQDGGNVI
jgi:hypothetical protein